MLCREGRHVEPKTYTEGDDHHYYPRPESFGRECRDFEEGEEGRAVTVWNWQGRVKRKGNASDNVGVGTEMHPGLTLPKQLAEVELAGLQRKGLRGH